MLYTKLSTKTVDSFFLFLKQSFISYMPELPEVETLKNSLENLIIDKVISDIVIHSPKIRYPIDIKLSHLQNVKILSIERRAKYLIINLSNDHSLVIHLGMSGKFYLVKANAVKNKHDHIVFLLNNSEKLIFNDIRRFGMIYLLPTKNLYHHKIFSNLGVEPLSSQFNVDYLLAKFKKKHSTIKVSLMDNCIVVGIGNIYASEILFKARIDPLRLANSLIKPELKEIIRSAKFILQEAINLGGTTLKDFVDAKQQIGSYSNKLLIYGKKICAECMENIVNLKQAGRTTYYCKNCQK